MSNEDFPEELKLNPELQEKYGRSVSKQDMKRRIEKYALSIQHVSPMLHKAMVSAYQQGMRDLVDMVNDADVK